MTHSIGSRLAALREEMRRERIAAVIIPSTDAHQSEYTAAHWHGREWISGFNGSAGTAVVTLHSAALWTDSRYFIAAADQLAGTEFRLMKERVQGTPTVAEWLGGELADDEWKEVSADGMVLSMANARALKADLQAHGGLTLRTNIDLLDRAWALRPLIPADSEVEELPVQLAGEPRKSKLDRLRAALRGLKADGILVSALDDIAWLLNLRGHDVEYNPVFVAYLLVLPAEAKLFVDKAKMPDDVIESLKADGVTTHDYAAVAAALKAETSATLLLSPAETSIALYAHTLHAVYGHTAVRSVVEAPSPIPAMKAVKNATEQRGYRAAMVRDGVAMVRWLMWLEEAMKAGGQTELSVARKLDELRSRQPLFRGLSFETISAYADHGAIVHYEPTEATDKPLAARSLLLVDSGAQYQDGTTDITRTIPLGPLTDEERRVYTLVLKAHIQLELAVFPDGACGTQIDALAREPLWRAGLNYMHGTGHGVGHYLCVHEGPHQVRMEHKPAPLHAGMTITDEPGVYLEGRFGVRIENTLLIREARRTEFGTFLGMESLTLCPIATAPIVGELMTSEELSWLNAYHQTVYDRLAPALEKEEREWLREATKSIS